MIDDKDGGEGRKKKKNTDLQDGGEGRKKKKSTYWPSHIVNLVPQVIYTILDCRTVLYISI